MMKMSRHGIKSTLNSRSLQTHFGELSASFIYLVACLFNRHLLSLPSLPGIAELWMHKDDTASALVLIGDVEEQGDNVRNIPGG